MLRLLHWKNYKAEGRASTVCSCSCWDKAIELFFYNDDSPKMFAREFHNLDAVDNLVCFPKQIVLYRGDIRVWFHVRLSRHRGRTEKHH